MHSSKALLLSLLAAGASAQMSMVSMVSSPVPAVTDGPASATVVLSSSSSNASASPVYTFYNTTVTTTVVVDELTTVCGLATTYTFNGCEYPVTAGETLVVTNCPCTLTTAVPTLTSELCPGSTAAAAAPAETPSGNMPMAPTMSSMYQAPASPTGLPPAVQVAGAPSGIRGAESVWALMVALVALFGVVGL